MSKSMAAAFPEALPARSGLTIPARSLTIVRLASSDRNNPIARSAIGRVEL